MDCRNDKFRCSSWETLSGLKEAIVLGIIMGYDGKEPKIAEDVFIAPNAAVIGDAEIKKGASIWFGATVRGDLQPIKIGEYTNIQDGAVIHVMGDSPTEIGDYVTVGHNALVHCRRIGNNCLIGMGSIVLGYSEIGENCIIGAGTLLTQYKKIPDNCLVYGNPAKIIRALRDDEIEAMKESAIDYHEVAMKYLRNMGEK